MNDKGFIIIPILIILSIAAAAGIYFYKPVKTNADSRFNIKKENQKMRELISMYYLKKKNPIKIVKTKKAKLPAGGRKFIKTKRIINENKKEAKIKNQEKIKPPKILKPSIFGDASPLPSVSLYANKTPLWRVIEELNEKTGYYFIAKHINLARSITINLKAINLAVLLNRLFGRSYKIFIYIDKKEVVIKK
ncbi:MAG: hypothetical protein M1467_04470 [Deltaproteobacteria bacterium]|nr:hypothetical protein [Deltaproteobacteria bacterium]MCL5880360.1 hypothetical protein [Deltaproteobacteria bacterium]